MKCGLFLHQDYPLFSASPDGITTTHVIEIKCPVNYNNVQKYFVDEERLRLKNKHYAQVIYYTVKMLFEQAHDAKEMFTTII